MSSPRTILTRAVEADLDGLFFTFATANPAGRVLAYACRSETQAVALMDTLINGLVRESAQAAAEQLKLDAVPRLRLLPGLGLLSWVNFGLFNAKGDGGGVAFFARVGGFILGLLVARLLAHAGQVAPGDRLRSTAQPCGILPWRDGRGRLMRRCIPSSHQV